MRPKQPYQPNLDLMPTDADFAKMRIFLGVVFIIFILALANGVVKTWKDTHKTNTEVNLKK